MDLKIKISPSQVITLTHYLKTRQPLDDGLQGLNMRDYARYVIEALLSDVTETMTRELKTGIAERSPIQGRITVSNGPEFK
jgi:hypothetical protein